MKRLLENKYLLSLYEAFFTSLVVGLAETYFVAFALHKGVSVVESGLLVSLPLVFAGISPFIFHKYYAQFKNSAWVQIASLIQAFSLACLVILAMYDFNHIFYLLMLVFSLYWFGHYSSLPSWNKWVHEIIPDRLSHNYFSQRSRISQIGIIVGLVLGGITLHLQVVDISTSLVFIFLFILTYHLKIISFYLFHKLPESNSRYSLSLIKKYNFFKKQKEFFKYYSFFNCSLFLSAPFVSGYLLNIRGLSYISYMFVMGSLFFGKIMCTYFLENYVKKSISPYKLFFWGGLLAAPLPVLWPICPGPVSMSFVHIVSGIGWAGWEVGYSLLIYKSIKPEEKIEAVSLYNTIGLPIQIIGTVIGAALLKYVYDDNYTTMFVVAGIVRFIMIIPMYRTKLGD